MTVIAERPSPATELNQNRRRPLIVPPGGGYVSPMPEGPNYYKAVGAQTGDSFALFELTVAPQGGPPPHIHDYEDECFYVLEGEYSFWVNGTTYHATAGTFAFLPKGLPHAFCNVGETTARHLVLCTPARIENFFERWPGVFTDGGAPDMTRAGSLCAEFGIHLLSPGMAADGEPAGAVGPAGLLPQIVPAGAGRSYLLPKHTVTFFVTGAETGGTFTAGELRVAPGGGPPPHVHSREDEAFYVLDGEIEFLVGSQTVRATPGTFVYLPQGTVHGFRNVSSAEARAFGLITPPGLEHFFADFARVCGSGLPGPAALMALGRTYGIEYV